MPRASRQARRPLQLSALAFSSVWEAKKSSEKALHPYLILTADTIILRGCIQYFLLVPKVKTFFFSKRTGSECTPWSISSGQQERGGVGQTDLC